MTLEYKAESLDATLGQRKYYSTLNRTELRTLNAKITCLLISNGNKKYKVIINSAVIINVQ